MAIVGINTETLRHGAEHHLASLSGGGRVRQRPGIDVLSITDCCCGGRCYGSANGLSTSTTSVSVVRVVVKHVRQDVLGILQSLGHFCIVRFEGLV